CPGGHRGAYTVHHRVGAVPLVQVVTAQEGQQVPFTGGDAAQDSAVSLHRRSQEPGQFRNGQFVLGVTEQIGGGCPARPHDEGDVIGVHAGARTQFGGGLLGGPGCASHYEFSVRRCRVYGARWPRVSSTRAITSCRPALPGTTSPVSSKPAARYARCAGLLAFPTHSTLRPPRGATPTPRPANQGADHEARPSPRPCHCGLM